MPPADYELLKAFLEAPETTGERSERARAVVTSALGSHVHPAMPGQEATVLVMVADAMEDSAFVLQVYAGLRDAGVAPSPLTLEYTAAACAQLGKWQTALEVIDAMHAAVDLMHASLSIYENAIAACHVDGKWMRAKQLIEEMRVHKLEASPELHLASIRLCIDNHEPTATRALVDNFLAVFDWDEIESESYLGELMDYAVAARSLPEALFFRDQLLDNGFAVSKDKYAALIELCALLRNWHQARVLLSQCVDFNAALPVAPPPARYAADITQLLQDLQTHGFELTLPLCNAALRNFGKLVMFDEAAQLLEVMQFRGVTPDATTFAAVITACGSRVEESDKYFEQLKSLQPSLSTDTFHVQQGDPKLSACHAYILAASRAQDYELVLERYHSVMNGYSSDTAWTAKIEGDVRIQSLVAIAQARLGDSKAMLKTFTGMKVAGLEPSWYVYGEAMYAYINLDQWRHALLLFDHICHQGFPARKLASFSMFWDAAIEASAHGEDVQRAATLFDTVVKDRVPISPHSVEFLVEMLVDVPCATLWDAFKRMEHLHRVRKESARSNPKVMNAHLKRAVEEKDTTLAERVFHEAESELGVVPNSMSYALMLRLCAKREDQAGFHLWASEMATANVKLTVFAIRAVLAHLETLDGECESPDYLRSVATLLGADDPLSVEELARCAMDRLEAMGHATDTMCLQNYLGLSQDPAHTTRVLAILEAAADDVALTSRFLHTLFLSVGAHPDRARVRRLLLHLKPKISRGLFEDALAAYCSCNDGETTLALLQELLATDDHALRDEQVLLFLASCYSQIDDDAEVEGDEPSKPQHGGQPLIEMCELLAQHDDVSLAASTVAFLVQQVVQLVNDSSSSGDSATQLEVDALQTLLTKALGHFSGDQVRSFLAQVVGERDLPHFEPVLQRLRA